jgi:DNA-binding response OmpR family regulator
VTRDRSSRNWITGPACCARKGVTKYSSLAIVGYTLSGQEVQLTYQEFELLAFLSANPAQVFSRADLLERVWGQQDNSHHHTRTVDVHVSRLRRKLGPAFGQCLTTEHRVGYRFDPALEISA